MADSGDNRTDRREQGSRSYNFGNMRKEKKKKTNKIKAKVGIC